MTCTRTRAVSCTATRGPSWRRLQRHASNTSEAKRIPNTLGKRPKTFEIDCLLYGSKEGVEIKWRDATTDGDHITKEHTRIKVISEAGYTPVRVMFYYPNRAQAVKIQQALETLYKGIGGEYYYGDSAWEYMQRKTGVELKSLLEEIENSPAAK